MKIMQETMRYLCANVQGCVFGYTQSDEITLVLTDYTTIKTDAWFGYNVQKMASIAASMATLEFNRLCYKEFQNSLTNEKSSNEKIDAGRRFALMEKLFKACFDARCFSVPIDEVCNCLIWRQQDAIRNSIEAVGHAYFSQSQLNGKPCSEIQYMLFMEKCIDWNSFPSDCKRGATCYRVITEERMEDPRNPNESEEETRAKLTNAIHEAMNNQNPEKRRIWDTFEFAGEEPTPEEFLLWFYRIYHLATELGNE